MLLLENGRWNLGDALFLSLHGYVSHLICDGGVHFDVAYKTQASNHKLYYYFVH
jgi:hypothetical protein